jgi:dihydropteroate synthase
VLDTAVWRVRGISLPLDNPLVMGIVNVTPDSFSDGGSNADHVAAIETGIKMVADGAAIIDVGGESTRPYAPPVEEAEELRRVIPVIEALADRGCVVSIDTTKPGVATQAAASGAAIVNDVRGLRDQAMRDVCAESGVGVVIMHMQGSPETMQDNPTYDDVVVDVGTFLATQSLAAIEAGIPIEAIAIDPGIGFGKTNEHSITLMQHLDVLTHLGYPVLVGTSRKGFLASILDPVRGATDPVDRDGATAATIALAVARGAAILRVHNVRLGVEVAVTAKAMVPTKSHDQEINRT